MTEKVILNDQTIVHDNQDLKGLIRFDEESGYIWLGQQRMILLHATAFGSMRSELISSFGEEYAKGVLMRMGYSSAQKDVILAKQLRPESSVLDTFIVGPQLHALEGIVSVTPETLEIDVDNGDFSGVFIWTNSFEAAEHLRILGKSESPVCWQLLGYASGYTSEFMGKPILYKEVECIGKGDKHCKIVGKPLDEWSEAEQKNSFFHSNKPIAEILYTLKDEVSELRSHLNEQVQPEEIIGDSNSMKEALKLIKTASECNVTVMMLGETGVGKEVFSQVLHKISNRVDKPFVAVNCAALPEDLIEAELFGVEKGAFTGAEKSRAGRFERADGGTLFLDELSELSARAQSKLLRVLQTGEFDRVGDVKTRKVDVRIIVATNEDLAEKVKQGEFRADLYYRLNVFPVTIPPLRERLEDLSGLIQKFIKRNNIKYSKKVLGVTDLAMKWFGNYSWPGNIRELENVIERGVLLTKNNQYIGTEHLMGQLQPEKVNAESRLNDSGVLAAIEDEVEKPISKLIKEGIAYEELEKNFLKEALLLAKGNVSAAARMVKMGDAQFRYRLKKHDLTL